MMPQKEVHQTIQQQADPAYGGYEGNHPSSAYQPSETSSEHLWREEQSGKIYPLPRNNANVLRFVLAVVSLGLLLLFGLLFVAVIGGTAGWISFAAACLAILTIAAISIEKIQ